MKKKTMTETVAGIPVMCCPRWKGLVNRIKVIPKNEGVFEDTYLCKAIEDTIKEFLGNYCPCCGAKL